MRVTVIRFTLINTLENISIKLLLIVEECGQHFFNMCIGFKTILKTLLNPY